MAGTVLIVEDERESRELLAALVGLSGHDTAVAADGIEALEVLARIRPCAMVLDLMMPRMNGWQVRERMLADPALADIPVVVLSGVADMDDAVASLGIQEALAKPIDVDRLLAFIGRCC